MPALALISLPGTSPRNGGEKGEVQASAIDRLSREEGGCALAVDYALAAIAASIASTSALALARLSAERERTTSSVQNLPSRYLG